MNKKTEFELKYNYLDKWTGWILFTIGLCILFIALAISSEEAVT